MSGLFGVLRTGASGLVAGQAGVQVASQNVANANTEGYSRRIVSLEPLGPSPLAGVRASGARRIVDELLERRMLGAESSEGEGRARMRALGVLDAVFAEGPGSIGDAFDRFQSALADLAASPHERAPRVSLLETADQLARAFRATAAELDRARTDANAQITQEVEQVNARLREIAELGKRIGEYEAARGREASDLRDRRDQLVREVARAVPVKVIEDRTGAVSLLLGGSRALVSPDATVHELRATPDPTSGDVRIARLSAGVSEDVGALLVSGTIGGLLAARDGALAQAREAVDRLAYDLASAYDAVHAAGVGLDGGTGRSLFEPPPVVDGAASSLRLSADVDGRPERIAAALDPAALPGDDRNALELLSIADADVASGGTQTVMEAYGALVATAGAAVRDAEAQAEHAEDVAAQIASLRSSTSGVSTDEEMISLMQFQRAYQASLQVVRTADEMLAELMSLRR